MAPAFGASVPGPLRGVNLGGWLVLEPWMTPSLFAGTSAVDEFTFMATPGAEARLRRHHETFVTESDFVWLAEHGLDLVRLPVGHWVLGGDPPYREAADVLDAAMDSAARHGLAVLLDLHAAAGSQNGQDHSGRVGARRWYGDRQHREHTHAALLALARRYAGHPALWGVEVVNEPMDWRVWRLLRFHREAYRRLSDVLGPGTRVVFSDGFLPWLLRGSVPAGPRLPAVMDSHLYHAFYPWDRRQSAEQHVAKARRRGRSLGLLARTQPVLVGEWSAALDPRAYGVRTGPERSALTAAFVAAQLEAYESAVGWCFWSYRTEQAGDWNFRHLVETGIVRL